MNPRTEHTSPPYERRPDRLIDQALRRLGSVMPAPGLEDRITARLAQQQKSQAAGGRVRLFFIPRFALGAAAAALACVAIVVGSVTHSHRTQPMLPGIGAQPAPSGMGPADAVRPPNRPVTPSPAGRPRSVRHLPEGRAVISPQSQKPAGVAVPKTPANP